MVMVRKRLGFWFDNHISYLLTESDVILFLHYASLRGLTAHLLSLSNDDMMQVPAINGKPYRLIKNGDKWMPYDF